MNNQIMDIYNSLQEIAWQFGSHGINGECCEDLSFVEFMALKKIDENQEISVQELGALLNFTKSGATKIVNRLEQKGYAARKSSPIDGRVCCVCTTEKGAAILTKFIGRELSHVNEMLKSMGPDKLQEINSVLKIFVNSANWNMAIRF